MNRLPTEIETLIWEFSGVYRQAFKAVLQQICMQRLLVELRTCTDYGHTCYSSNCNHKHYYFSHEYKRIICSSDCCEWLESRRKAGHVWFCRSTIVDFQERTDIRF
jgi:hypothetical protein